MELWGWLVGYVVLFALLHLVLYYLYVRQDGDERPASSMTDGRRTSPRYSPTDGYLAPGEDVDSDPDVDPDLEPDLDGETIRCPHCGIVNEADTTYTYCWNCISSLRG